MSLKLYVLIRNDITEAQQAVQAGHALAQFGADHPKEFLDWQATSNILVYLSVNLVNYWRTVLEDGGFVYSVFHEPDMYEPCWRQSGDEPGIDTAIAVAPSWICQYLLFKDLPLAFQPKPVELPPRQDWSPLLQVPEPEPEPKRRWWQ